MDTPVRVSSKGSLWDPYFYNSQTLFQTSQQGCASTEVENPKYDFLSHFGQLFPQIWQNSVKFDKIELKLDLYLIPEVPLEFDTL